MFDIISRIIMIFAIAACILFCVMAVVAVDRNEKKSEAERVKPCVEFSKVVSIGGCDADGRCGVVLENGNKSRESYPVVDEAICIKK